MNFFFFLMYSFFIYSSELVFKFDYDSVSQPVEIYEVLGDRKYFVGGNQIFDPLSLDWQSYKNSQLSKIPMSSLSSVKFSSERNFAFVLLNTTELPIKFVIRSDGDEVLSKSNWLWECLCLKRPIEVPAKRLWIHHFRVTPLISSKTTKLELFIQKAK